jgi:hypothetical protein
MLHDPWRKMKRGTLYIGDETDIVECGWLRSKNSSKLINNFIDENSSKQLLNAGVVGGDRTMVLKFLKKQVETINQILQSGEDLQSDMGIFNYTAYTFFENVIEHGRKVTTIFKAYHPDNLRPGSWWRHK